jgi:membrane peptidoglycan carboxypeptidase
MAGLLGFSALAGVLVTVMVAPAVAVTGVTASSTIGIFDSIPEYLDLGELPERNEIYVVDSTVPGGYRLAATVFDQNRESVSYDEISQFALDATVAGEDRRFFDHGGVDIIGIIRAAMGNVTSGGIESGASTLTMQLVKNTYVQEALEKETEEERQAAYLEAIDPNFDRKLKEMKIAIGLEKRYTKKEILVAYLNVAYFSDQTYGIQAAAQRYFGVDAKDLTLAQSASLIAIVQYPNQRGLEDPENFGENEVRRDFILGQMLKEGFVTQEQYDEAYAIPVDEAFVAGGQVPQQGCRTAEVYYRWFCDYVVKSVKDFEFLGSTPQEREDNWSRGGYQLYTTLDAEAQRVAHDALQAYTPPSETAFRLGGAVSTVQPGTGRVLVMAENKIFDDAFEPTDPAISSAVNFNTSLSYGNSLGIQAGSTYKLFTLLQWLNTGHGVNEVVNGSARTEPASSFSDRCTGAIDQFKFKNNSNEAGNFPVRYGTVQSINGVFVSMAKELDLCDINQLAASLGVRAGSETTLPNNPSSILGVTYVTPLSMATAYAAVAAGGKTCEPIVVDRYIDPAGEEHVGQSPKCAQVLDPDVIYTAIDVLKGVMVSGNSAYSNPEDGIPIFGKTGTTDSGKDTNMASSGSATSQASTTSSTPSTGACPASGCATTSRTT